MTNLDNSVRKFRGYCNGENAFDELDFKKEVWKFIQSTCMDIIGDEEQLPIGEQGVYDSTTRTFELIIDSPAVKYHIQRVMNNNTLRAEQRARLMERMK